MPSTEGGYADLCEEGLGFGVPLLQYARDFIFPGLSRVSHEGAVMGDSWKIFDLNLIERQQRGSDNEIHTFSWVYQRIFNRAYKAPLLRKVIRLTRGTTFRRASMRQAPTPRFFRVASRGEVPVSYRQEGHDVRVSVDFRGIDRAGLQRMYVSNELGGTLFDHYADSSGTRLHGDEIGGWEQVRSRWAGFAAPTKGVKFAVEIPDDVEAFMGREIIPPTIRWSGVILQVPPSCTELSYRVSVRMDTLWG